MGATRPSGRIRQNQVFQRNNANPDALTFATNFATTAATAGAAVVRGGLARRRACINQTEAFNTFNHVNLNIPIFQLDQVLFNTALSVQERLAQSRAGTYNQTRGEMHELQFALRLNF